MSTGETSGGGGGTSTWDWDTGTAHPGTTASHARISLAEKTAAVTKYTALAGDQAARHQALSCGQRRVSHRCRVMK